MVQSIEDYSLQNISNRINLRRIQTSTLHIRFPVFLRWRAMHHVSMYFLRKTVFHFLPRDKDHVFGKNTPSFQIIQERSYAGVALFGKTIFSKSLKKRSYSSSIFLERPSVQGVWKKKIWFSVQCFTYHLTTKNYIDWMPF